MKRKVGGGMEFVDFNISQGFFFSKLKCNAKKKLNWSPLCHWFPKTAGVAPKLCCFLGISTRLVSAIWGFYADSKSSLVTLFHSTNFTGPLAQSAVAENQVSSIKYTDIPKISITAFFP